MAAYAAATATSASFETIRDAATPGEANKPARSTTVPYRDVLERLWILDPVHAWVPTRNHISRLTQAPKHHLVDPALAAQLLGVGTEALLEGQEAGLPVPRDGTLLGHLFESLVTQSVRVYAQAAEATVGHMRTAKGRQEIDLIVERDDQCVVAIEVKLNRAIADQDVRHLHLHWLRDRLGEDLLDAVVISTGPQAYPQIGRHCRRSGPVAGTVVGHGTGWGDRLLDPGCGGEGTFQVPTKCSRTVRAYSPRNGGYFTTWWSNCTCSGR